MKKLILICLMAWFFIGSMAPNMQGVQLIKLPNLLSHVEKHFGSDWTLSELKSFVVEHYLDQSLPQDNEHKNLPFKTIHGHCSILIADQKLDLSIPQVLTIEDFSLTKPVVAQSQALLTRPATIWIPPQLA